MPPLWPRSSVLFFASGEDGDQILRVRLALPVAMKIPVGDQAMVRMVWEPGPREEGSW